MYGKKHSIYIYGSVLSVVSDLCWGSWNVSAEDKGYYCINNKLRIWNLINKPLGKKGEIAETFEGETNRTLDPNRCSG